jgi:hypothetical protein
MEPPIRWSQEYKAASTKMSLGDGGKSEKLAICFFCSKRYPQQPV